MARILESSNSSATLSVTALDLLPPALEILGLEISFIWRPSPKMSSCPMQRSLPSPRSPHTSSQTQMVRSHLTATEKALRAFVYRERGTRSPLAQNEKRETRLGSIEDEIWSSFSFCKPTWGGIGAFLGVGPHESSRNPVIDVFASNHTLSFVSVGKPVINTVEDVKRDFYQNFEHMVREKLSNGPFTTTRIDVPKEQTLPVENCVYRLTWPGKSNQIHEKSAMIGLFREPGSIKVSQWDVPMDEWNLPVDESTRDLQRSISK